MGDPEPDHRTPTDFPRVRGPVSAWRSVVTSRDQDSWGHQFQVNQLPISTKSALPGCTRFGYTKHDGRGQGRNRHSPHGRSESEQVPCTPGVVTLPTEDLWQWVRVSLSGRRGSSVPGRSSVTVCLRQYLPVLSTLSSTVVVKASPLGGPPPSVSGVPSTGKTRTSTL